MAVKKLRSVYLFLLVFLTSCVVQNGYNRPGDLEFKSQWAVKQEKEERLLLEYIAKRTVRVISSCKIVNTKTGKVAQKYKESGWGTGAVIISKNNYSLIQTAFHVVDHTDTVKGGYKKSCDKFVLERRDLSNKITGIYDKVTIYKKNKTLDIAVLIVPYDLGVSSSFSDKMYIGQKIRLLGYPYLRGVSGKHLSYADGKILTINMGKQPTWKDVTDITRYSTIGYFGNSGGAVWTSEGKIVGIITSMTGFRTMLGSFIPQSGCLYGLGLNGIRNFYKQSGVEIH